MRNSLLVAPMPTASTSQILGNNECLSPTPPTSTPDEPSAVSSSVVNKHLLRDLTKLGFGMRDMKNQLIAANGSIQAITEIPENLKDAVPHRMGNRQRAIIDMAADRGASSVKSSPERVHGERKLRRS